MATQQKQQMSRHYWTGWLFAKRDWRHYLPADVTLLILV